MTGNLFAYSAQVALIVLTAAVMLKLLRPRMAGAKLAFLRALLAACLSLPFVQPWKPPQAPPGQASRGAVVTFDRSGTPMRGSAPFDWTRAFTVILCAGIAARAGWLLLGLVRLRGYRAKSAPLGAEPDSVTRARQLIDTQADLRLSTDLATPATFGFLQPVVLLPAHFTSLAETTQTAIAAHELLHVRRRDWLWTLAEEAVSVLLWFHPAIAWLISRIRLAREQHVDEVVADAIGSRDAYVDALMTMAAAKRQAWSPAPLFLTRRTLPERIRNLIEEAPMSYRKSLLSYTGAAALAVIAAGFAVTKFPLLAAPQANASIGPVSIDPGGAIDHQMAIRYPLAAMKQRVEGALTVEATLAPDGTVSDARVVSGPEELRKPALQSILQWRYKPGVNPKSVTITITFRAPDRLPEAPSQQVLRWVDVSKAPAEKREAFRARLEPLIGKTMDEVRAGITEAMRDIDPSVGIQWNIDPVTGDNAIALLGPSTSATSSSAGFPPPAEGVKRLRVGGNVQSNKLLLQVPPQYPALAKQARIQGAVRFEVLINRDGTVKSLAVANGHPLLVDAAQDAVRHWTWQTTLLNGEPVEVLTVVDVNFTLMP